MNLEGIKNIIFDFGGVILNIDFNLTVEAFEALGIENARAKLLDASTSEILHMTETGKISPASFYDYIRNISSTFLSDDEIRNAWNKLLLDLPEENILLLRKIKSQFRIFLLSNTNLIHYNKYSEDLKIVHGVNSFEEIFEKAWFSFRIGLAKPDTSIFYYALHDAGLKPEETLFIDDSEENIEAARKTGLQTYLLKKGTKLTSLFDSLSL
jgi:glucose-1-phosphatase